MTLALSVDATMPSVESLHNPKREFQLRAELRWNCLDYNNRPPLQETVE